MAKEVGSVFIKNYVESRMEVEINLLWEYRNRFIQLNNIRDEDKEALVHIYNLNRFFCLH